MAGPWDKYANSQAPSAPQQQTTSQPWINYASQPSATVYEGSILPFNKDAQGQTHFDSDAGIIGAIKRAIMAPGDAYNGNLQVMGNDGNVTPEAISRANEFAATFSPITPGLRAGEAIVPGAAQAYKANRVEPPTMEELKQSAKEGYDRVRDMGVQYSSNSIAEMARQTQANLEAEGIIAELAPKTFSTLQKLQSPPDGSVITSSGIEAARRTFGKIGQGFDNPTDQGAGKTVRSALDNFVSRPPDGSVLPGYEQAAARAAQESSFARGDYAAAKRSESLNGIQDAADLRAAAANSGANGGNAIRQRVASLLLSPKRVSGFNDAETAQLEGIVNGSAAANATRYIGNLLGGGGGLGSAVTSAIGAGAGMASGSPTMTMAGAALPLAGAISKKISNQMTESALRAADEATRARSPLYEALSARAGKTPDIPEKTTALIRALLIAQRQQYGEN